MCHVRWSRVRAPMSKPSSNHEAWIAAILIVCVGLAGFWQLMARRSARPFQPFDLTAGDFGDFVPQTDAWIVQRLPLPDDPVEPNILMYEFRPVSTSFPLRDVAPSRETAGFLASRSYYVRLVHGYDMVDCMRIKGFQVEALARPVAESSVGDEVSGLRASAPLREASGTSLSGGPVQFWLLTSGTGTRYPMLTSMVRAGDFSETGIDTRTMPFPKAATPDNPGWFPQGMTWRSLRHPVRNFRTFLRSQWNASRNDVATFLKLRQPAWASAELLTIVVMPVKLHVDPSADELYLRDMERAYRFFLSELRAWRRSQP